MKQHHVLHLLLLVAACPVPALAVSLDAVRHPKPATAHTINLEALRREVATEMQTKLSTPLFLNAIKAQNRAHADFTEADIKALDTEWQAEFRAPRRPLIEGVLTSEASRALRQIADASHGRYVEIFITDNKGLNVAITNATSDYWQGDEAKFQQTFPKGVSATYAEAPRFDESAVATVAEVDGTLSEGTTPIGTFTVKVRVD